MKIPGHDQGVLHAPLQLPSVPSVLPDSIALLRICLLQHSCIQANEPNPLHDGVRPLWQQLSSSHSNMLRDRHVKYQLHTHDGNIGCLPRSQVRYLLGDPECSHNPPCTHVLVVARLHRQQRVPHGMPMIAHVASTTSLMYQPACASPTCLVANGPMK